MVNCAGGMNVSHVVEDPPRSLQQRLIKIFTNSLKNDFASSQLFHAARKPENVKNVL